MKKLSVALAVLFIVPALSAEDITREFPAKGFSVVQIESDSGDVIYAGAKASAAAVVMVRNYDSSRCEFDARLSGGRLVVSLKNKTKKGFLAWFRGEKTCPASLNLSAPEGLGLELAAGVSNISVSNITGAVDASVGSGSVKLEKTLGVVSAKMGAGNIVAKDGSSSMDLRTGSGNINASGLKGSLTCRSGAGSVDAQWDTVPQQGDATAESGAGNVRLAFPAGTKAAVTMESGVGSTSNDIGSYPDSKFKINIKTGVGNQSVIVK